MYFIVDCNNFYASCERVFNPALRAKPIVVLSNNDGCIIARSNESKALGIPMGAPVFQYASVIRQHDVYVASSNFALYGDMSHRVMETIRTCMQNDEKVEIYSIDEAFVDVSDVPISLLELLAQELRTMIVRWTGIPVSIGIAPSKTLAKLANKYTKKFRSTVGYTFVTPQSQDYEGVLRAMKTDDIWGIGRKYHAFLQRYDIRTAYDFCQAPDEWIRKHFTITGWRIQQELRGIRCMPLEHQPPDKKMIASTRSFTVPLETLHDCESAIATFITRACEKLRSQHSVCKHLSVFMRTNPFARSEREPSYAPRCDMELIDYTDSTLVLIEAGMQALHTMYRHGYRYKKAGICLSDIRPDRGTQEMFFSTTSHRTPADHTALMQSLDRINTKYGRNTLRSAIVQKNMITSSWERADEESIENKMGVVHSVHHKTRLPMMCRKSPSYTTDWQHLKSVE